MKKKFKEKYQRVIDILEKNYNFNKTLEKRIWSLGTLSNMKAMDILFKNKWRGGRVVEGARLESV